MLRFNISSFKRIPLALITLAGILSAPLSVGANSPQMIECQSHQESFGFAIRDWQVKHQGTATIDVAVDYRLDTNPNAINADDYPNYLPIAKDIKSFIHNYPNEEDFWEIVNKKLAQSLMEDYSRLTSLNIKMTVRPTSPRNHYHRHSEITVTRNGHCSLTH